MLLLWEAQKYYSCSQLKKDATVQNTGQESECVLQKIVNSSYSLAQKVQPFSLGIDCEVSHPQASAK